MARAEYIKKARKPNPVVSQDDIDRAKEGAVGAASYYKWSFRYGGTHYSKTHPKPSQLTQSEYYIGIYSIQEEMQDAGGYEDADDLESARDDWAERAREIGEECREKFDNMPEGFQQGDTGVLLEDRAEEMENWAGEIEGVDVDADDRDENDTVAEYLQAQLEEMAAIEPNIE